MKDMSYETAISRLEEIVALLQSGKASLDESISLYDEGLTLAKLCNEKLADAKQKVIGIDEYLKDIENNE